MALYELDIPWKLIEPEDPMGADMVDIRDVKRKWLDVPYAEVSPSQVLDIYLPEKGDGPFPTYIFLHGGAFIAGDKQDLQFLLAADGINRGYAVVSVEYRKAFESKAPNALYDVKAAIRFLRAHAEEYRLDPGRFALGGDSAGAYYAVFAAATAGVPAFDGPDPVLPEVCGKVQAVVAQCGCYDLLTMTPPEEEIPKEGEGGGLIPPDLTTIFIGANPRRFPDTAALLDPVTYITKDFPPALVQVGRDDAIVPCTESQRLADVLERRCGRDRVVFQIFDGWNHCALNHIVTPDWFMSENMDRVFGFLDGILK
ncbi:MAG: alpha/beta hydrolase [Oscillospiraceae bacterium]|nr:alpha/beta hydrolase [Oscillospiraceae bacterium]